jgi:hypothetical protein
VSTRVLGEIAQGICKNNSAPPQHHWVLVTPDIQVVKFHFAAHSVC